MSNYKEQSDDYHDQVSSSSSSDSSSHYLHGNHDTNTDLHPFSTASPAPAIAGTDGRPPRPRSSSQDQPQDPTTTTAVHSHHHHHRVASMGESSILSALTTEPELIVTTPTENDEYPSLEEKQDLIGTAASAADILQPNLEAGTSKLSFQEQRKSTTTFQPKVFGRLNLRDILNTNPMESEAEHAILKAVEEAQLQKQQQQQHENSSSNGSHSNNRSGPSHNHHRRTNTVGSAFLPSIPDDAVQNFTNDDLVFPFGQEDNVVATSPQQPPLEVGGNAPPQTLRPRLGSAASSRRMLHQNQQLSPVSMASKRTMTDNGSIAAASRTSKSAIVGALPSTNTQDTLLNVTEQLKDIHYYNNTPANNVTSPTSQQQQGQGPPPQMADAAFAIPLPTVNDDMQNNAQDFFVRNANMLFRRSTTVHKNHDDVDIELGGSGDTHEDNDDVNHGDLPTPQAGNNTNNDEDDNKKNKHPPKFTFTKITHTLQKKSTKAGHQVMENFDYVRDYLKPKTKSIGRVSKMAILYMMLPAFGLSVGLYYAGNPRICASTTSSAVGGAEETEAKTSIQFEKMSSSSSDPACASVSWFLMFLFIRQAVTLGLAKCLEVLIIDLLSVRSRRMLKIVGPIFTLLIVQSKGFPFVLLMWSILDFLLLYGDGQFANHWLFWQDWIPWFNDKNPSGEVLTNDFYQGLLVAGIIIGATVAIKRLWMGVYLGKRTYTNYGKELAKVMNDMLLISIVATIGRDIEFEETQEGPSSPDYKRSKGHHQALLFQGDWGDDLDDNAEDESTSVASLERHTTNEEKKTCHSPPSSPRKPLNKPTPASQRRRSSSFDGVDSNSNNVESTSAAGQSVPITVSPRPSPSRTTATLDGPTYDASFHRSTRMKIEQLLGAWEEPARNKEKFKNVTIASILQFRQALEFMDNLYPFSVMFGPASTREACVESSQELYKRLMLRTPDEPLLPFESIALAGTDPNEETQRKRLKRLHRMFVPNKDGYLTPLDFIKSVDNVYKSLRMLRASIENSGQIDEAFEKIFNSMFYVILGCIVLSALGYNPLALFLSLSSIILSFAFMIGSASAKYFEGILLIFARRPYDIGDKIHVSDPSKDCSGDGSPGWFVENVDLFTTTVRYGTTNEVATYSNGSLASMRIINAKRSPLAIRYVRVKFGVDVEYAKVEVFKSAVETFVKERPREWVAMTGFRATRVEADLGYIEYVIVCQHVEGWQNMGPILNSAAELHQYCLEVSKQLGMRYTAPPLPVHLDLAKKDMLAQMMAMSGNPNSENTSIPPGGKMADTIAPLSMSKV